LSQKKETDHSLIQLRVSPNAGRNEVTGLINGVLQIKIAAPPVKGKANEKLVGFLSQALGVSKSSITVVKGHASRNKIIAVAGLSRETIITRLSSAGATRQSNR
jgi:uncharacterized protein (TIGR00251 family)